MLIIDADEEDSCVECDHCGGLVHVECVPADDVDESYFWCSYCRRPHQIPDQIVDLSATTLLVKNQYHLAQEKHEESVKDFRLDMGERLERLGDNRLPSDNILVNPEFLYKL